MTSQASVITDMISCTIYCEFDGEEIIDLPIKYILMDRIIKYCQHVHDDLITCGPLEKKKDVYGRIPFQFPIDLMQFIQFDDDRLLLELYNNVIFLGIDSLTDLISNLIAYKIQNDDMNCKINHLPKCINERKQEWVEWKRVKQLLYF
jgi:hypothetical protein